MNSPSYVSLARSGALHTRARELAAVLRECRLCPWACGVDRTTGQTKVCGAGSLPVVSSYAPHFGEEPALSGTHLPPGEARGSGNIFFGHCNLRCVYCQNWQISQEYREEGLGEEVTPDRLAAVMLELQERGCHNIGLVSPAPHLAGILDALSTAALAGLRLPLVYNSNGYDGLAALRMLEDVVDIYLPDLKYSDDRDARVYSKAPEYVRHSRAAVEEMYRQVGDQLLFDGRGLLRRGLVVRLLILPNGLAGIEDTLRWIRDTLSPKVTLSVMSQYYPAYKAAGDGYPLLARKIRPREYERVLGWLDALGFENGWVQPLEGGAADYYRPDFADPAEPFKDAADFR